LPKRVTFKLNSKFVWPPRLEPDVAMSDANTLVQQLNALLQALQIPILLQSPTDLTPSLLIAILESILSTRIPLEFSPGRSLSKTNTGIQSMKVFLGVLESDIVKMDVGLSNIDPLKLANGEWEEVVCVGEVLCWVGQELGLLVGADDDDEFPYVASESNDDSAAHINRPYSPSPSAAMSITTKKTNTVSNFSLHRHTESNTSISFSSASLDSSTPTPSPRTRPLHLPPLDLSQHLPPRCIHEVPSPAVVLTPDIDNTFQEHSYCTRPDQSQNPAVRYTGYIEPVDEELELRSFESSQSMYNQEPSDNHKVSLTDCWL
jgi:hypothetical protein